MLSKSSIRIFIMQVSALTIGNMKARYRKTFAGFLWVALNPIIMYTAQSFVFRKFLKIDVPNYSIFLLSGLLPWIFITMTLDMVTPILDFSGELLKSFKINPAVLVFSQVLDNFINFLFSFFIILIPFWVFTGEFSIGIIFLPLSLFFLLLGVISSCWVMAFLQVFYKDVRFVISFLTSILFFLTPIFYPVEYIPENYRILVHINPIYALIAPFRESIYSYDSHSMSIALLKSFIVSLLSFVLALYLWKKKRNEFYYAL
jgi:lipopolysaccharide transport system permease protein